MARKSKKAEEKAIVITKPININHFDVILRPIITEKSMRLLEQENKVTVKVAKDANAIEVKEAFEALFKVKVDKVNMVNVPSRKKRVGRYEGIIGGYKKAIVKLQQGQAIDLFKSFEAEA
ncbi:TPA: 50S ribosomal protein L23 [bacterium]|nr:50S ribosomal protein L23 [bacterium]